MRLFSILFILFAAVLLVRAQWDKDDYEIFELQAALEKDEGEGTNFYSFFNLTRSASAKDIRKAYRARSMELHPDKHASNPAAARRFERLGVINKILRDHRRDRYDHFLTNGFPKWRGSGYFYARYRPGLISVLVFLVLITSTIELVIKTINYKRDQERLKSLITTAKVLAWGPRFRSIEDGLKTGDNSQNKNVIVPGEKKVRVPLSGLDIPEITPRKPEEDETAYWDNDEKAVRKAIAAGTSANNNSALEYGSTRRYADALVTRESEVLIMDPVSKEWTPLDLSSNPKPSFSNTWSFNLVRGIVAKVVPSSGGGAIHSELQGSDNNASNAVSSVDGSSSKKRKNKKKQQ
ncbi:hypothetical protein L7F22_043946 [Adiantum nelumboides]|nr:hypothetical protein [Adiantum nelumboides]